MRVDIRTQTIDLMGQQDIKINNISKDQSNTIILALPLETLRTANVEGIAAMSAI